MTAADKPNDQTVVTALRRPPVRQFTLVRASASHTFDTFVATIGAWWPVQPLSVGGDRVRDVTIERRSAGRVYETWDNGSEVDWGTVTAWKPPVRFVMTWNLTPAATEVEFTFAALGPALTKVAVEHRGWDALTEEQLAEACALPGHRGQDAFTAGWAMVLDHLANAMSGIEGD